MMKTYTDTEGREHLEISLCPGCIDDLEDYNPYIDSKGETIPLERIHPIETDIKHCHNTIITKGGK